MDWKKVLIRLVVTLAVIMVIIGLTACQSTATTTTPTTATTTNPVTSAIPTTSATQTNTAPAPGGPGQAVINSDSIVTAQIQAIRKQTNGYPWEVDVKIESSVDVDSLPNPTKDSVGKVITVKTDQDMSSYKVNDVVTARVKYVGDVPKPGITLYIYNIALEIKP